MEAGQRKDEAGAMIPRSIINRFTCDFDVMDVVDVEILPSVSSNPYFEFEARVGAAGEFRFNWHDDDGSIHEDVRAITIA